MVMEYRNFVINRLQLEGVTGECLKNWPFAFSRILQWQKTARMTGIRFSRDRVTSPVDCCLRFLFRLSCLFAIATAITACDKPPEAGDKTDIKIVSHNGLFLPDSEVGKEVARHVEFMYSVGPDAEANYQASLERLREMGDEAVGVIMQSYKDSPVIAKNVRTTLVETLAELRLASARDPLIHIAREPLPERVALPDDYQSLLHDELIVRMTAIRGISHLAVNDDKAADYLVDTIDHSEMAIKEQARVGLALVIEHEKDIERFNQLVKAFDGDYQDWLPLRRNTPPAPFQNSRNN